MITFIPNADSNSAVCFYTIQKCFSACMPEIATAKAARMKKKKKKISNNIVTNIHKLSNHVCNELILNFLPLWSHQLSPTSFRVTWSTIPFSPETKCLLFTVFSSGSRTAIASLNAPSASETEIITTKGSHVRIYIVRMHAVKVKFDSWV